MRGTTTEAKYYAEGEATRVVEDWVATVDLDVYFELILLGYFGHEHERCKRTRVEVIQFM